MRFPNVKEVNGSGTVTANYLTLRYGVEDRVKCAWASPMELSRGPPDRPRSLRVSRDPITASLLGGPPHPVAIHTYPFM
jgi:hypothetical protein